MENVIKVKQAQEQVKSTKKKRFEALDIVRGFTIAMMILANNPGSWGHMWPFLEHAPWIGFTMTDWIFPSFITCMGFAMVFSLKHVNKIDLLFLRKVVIRGLALILIGYVFSAASGTFSRMSDGKDFVTAINETFYNFRFYGVFVRLGLTFLLSGTIIVLTKKNLKLLIGITSCIIVGYLFLLGFGHGYEFSKSNVIYIVDNAIFSPNHLYAQTIGGLRLTMDPEGLISTIPCIGQALMSFIIGKIFIEYKGKNNPLLGLFVTASLLIICGLFMSTFCPISKKVWSISFVLITSGITFGLISIVSFFAPKKHSEKVFYPWKVLGVNSLGVYIISSIIGMILNDANVNNNSLHVWIYKGFSTMCGTNADAASFIYAMMILVVSWFIALFLYKKKIYIKL